MFARHDRRFGMRNALPALILALIIPLTTLIATPAHAAGTIVGTVTATGGAPMTNVEVAAYALNDAVEPAVWEIMHVAYTQANGTYSLAIPANGTYRLGFTDLDGIYETEFFSNAATVDVASDVIVTGGNLTRNAVLIPKGWISGTVTDVNGGDPINEVDVVLYQYFDNGADSYWGDVAYTQTDADGNYQVYASPGTYRVGFDGTYVGFGAEYYDDVTDVFDGTPVVVTAGNGTESIDATLDSRGIVSGHVTDQDTGDPLEGISVNFYANNGTPQVPDWQYESGVTTDSAGYYEYAGPNPVRVGFDDPDATYAAEYFDNVTDVDNADTVNLSAGGLFPDVDAALVIAGHITGTVTDPDDAPLAGIEVDVYRNEGTLVNPQWEAHYIAYTDENGDYDVPVGADTYRVGFFGDFGSPVYYDAQDSVETADDVVVAESATVPNVDAEVLSSATETVTNNVAPKISGTAKVGSTLKASPGTWTPSDADLSYAWLASGKAIIGADSATFKVTGAQVDKRISVLVSASVPTLEDGAALSAATSKVVVEPVIKLTAKTKKSTVKLKVRLSASGVTNVAGKVKIFRKSKLLETLRLKSGSAKVKLTKQPSGKAKYTAKYLGSGPVLPVKKSVKVAV